MSMAPASLCPHFGPCGGCLWQDLEAPDYRMRKQMLVCEALRACALEAEVATVMPVPPRSRRRAWLKADKHDGAVRIGFHGRASHELIDIKSCLILAPGLFARLDGLRRMLREVLRDGERIELYLADSDTGIDLALQWKGGAKPGTVTRLARWAEALKLARVTVNGQAAVLLAQPVVHLGKAAVVPPPGAFLQPTLEGEARLQSLVVEALGKAKRVADLYAGCGTFTFVAAERAAVHAVEADAPALAALSAGARRTTGLKPISTELRNLAKLPLSPPELKVFDAVVLDPPRAGAPAQVQNLAASAVRRIVYVSCNPTSFARDARLLVASGFAVGRVQPLDQFLWSEHIELVARFDRA